MFNVNDKVIVKNGSGMVGKIVGVYFGDDKVKVQWLDGSEGFWHVAKLALAPEAEVCAYEVADEIAQSVIGFVEGLIGELDGQLEVWQIEAIAQRLSKGI
jgi:hypothetical protein